MSPPATSATSTPTTLPRSTATETGTTTPRTEGRSGLPEWIQDGVPILTAPGTTLRQASPGGPTIPGAGTPSITATGSSPVTGGAGRPLPSTRRPGSTGATPPATSDGARSV